MRRKQTLVVILLLFGATVPAFAQRFTASLRGTVTDSTDAVLAGATVSVKGTETGLTRTGYTNESGIYIFAELPVVGKYQLEVELDGFKKALVSEIELNVADERRLDVQLELGEIVEEITTVASAISVETIGGEVSGLVQGEQIRELPLNGRNFVQLTLLMPGVATPDGFNTKNKGLMTGVDMSVSGSAVTNNLWLVDGANNNDVGSNRMILVYPSVDAIEQFNGATVKDKLHFFVSQEYNDETRGVVHSGLVSTMAERNGDFSSPIPGCSPPIPVDPVTGEPFPGNMIPADRLAPNKAGDDYSHPVFWSGQGYQALWHAAPWSAGRLPRRHRGQPLPGGGRHRQLRSPRRRRLGRLRHGQERAPRQVRPVLPVYRRESDGAERQEPTVHRRQSFIHKLGAAKPCNNSRVEVIFTPMDARWTTSISKRVDFNVHQNGS